MSFGINISYKIVMEFISRIFALLLLVVLSPFLFLIMFVSLIFQGFPIFYRQQRIGYNYNIFKIIKFRTMNKNSGDVITKPNDSRITYFGMFLRKTKIDEIPQLLNILSGDMRFIGPRPEVPEYFDKEQFQFLKKIKPGISDYASIILRDESKILERIGGSNPYKMLLPMKLLLAQYYTQKKSFMLDLKLVLVTILSIIFS